jgi:hypothetical protein
MPVYTVIACKQRHKHETWGYATLEIINPQYLTKESEIFKKNAMPVETTTFARRNEITYLRRKLIACLNFISEVICDLFFRDNPFLSFWRHSRR